jgi:hypothetical protein
MVDGWWGTRHTQQDLLAKETAAGIKHAKLSCAKTASSLRDALGGRRVFEKFNFAACQHVKPHCVGKVAGLDEPKPPAPILPSAPCELAGISRDAETGLRETNKDES